MLAQDLQRLKVENSFTTIISPAKAEAGLCLGLTGDKGWQPKNWRDPSEVQEQMALKKEQ